jgi:hypothetical protein
MLPAEDVRQVILGDWRLGAGNLLLAFRRGVALELAEPTTSIVPNLSEAPLSVRRGLALLASMAEYEAVVVRRETAPAWAMKIRHLEEPWFPANLKNFIATALRDSPVNFKRRNIFITQDFFSRA